MGFSPTKRPQKWEQHLMDAFPDIEMETMALQKCKVFVCPQHQSNLPYYTEHLESRQSFLFGAKRIIFNQPSDKPSFLSWTPDKL